MGNQRAEAIVVETSGSATGWRIEPGSAGPLAYVSRESTLSIFTADCTLLVQEDLSVYALHPVFWIDAAGGLHYQLPFLGGDYVPTGISDVTPCSRPAQ